VANSARAPAGIPGTLTLDRPIVLTGIRAQAAPDGASLMAVARRPDGTTEPLLWLYNYRARFGHPYWYTAPLRLPAGTRIEITPPEAGAVVLLARCTL
jgi:hypothetical protein